MDDVHVHEDDRVVSLTNCKLFLCSVICWPCH